MGGAPEDCGTLCTGSGPETGPILVAARPQASPRSASVPEELIQHLQALAMHLVGALLAAIEVFSSAFMTKRATGSGKPTSGAGFWRRCIMTTSIGSAASNGGLPVSIS